MSILRCLINAVVFLKHSKNIFYGFINVAAWELWYSLKVKDLNEETLALLICNNYSNKRK